VRRLPLRQTIATAGVPGPEIIEAIAAGDQPPELTAEALAERIDFPSTLGCATKTRGDRLVGSRSISSSHLAQARRRIDPAVRLAWMEPPHLPTETLAASGARTGGKCFSPVPRITQMSPQAHAIPPFERRIRKDATRWRSKVNSNCRYWFLNCQTTPFCYNLRS
jgi:hypothetical protein